LLYLIEERLRGLCLRLGTTMELGRLRELRQEMQEHVRSRVPPTAKSLTLK